MLGTSLAASLYFLCQGDGVVVEGMTPGTVRSLLALMAVPDGGVVKKAVATKLSGFAQFKKRGRAGAGQDSDEPLQRELNAIMKEETSVLGDGGNVRQWRGRSGARTTTLMFATCVRWPNSQVRPADLALAILDRATAFRVSARHAERHALFVSLVTT